MKIVIYEEDITDEIKIKRITEIETNEITERVKEIISELVNYYKRNVTPSHEETIEEIINDIERGEIDRIDFYNEDTSKEVCTIISGYKNGEHIKDYEVFGIIKSID